MDEIATRELTKDSAKIAKDDIQKNLGYLVITKENNLNYKYDNNDKIK